ncbi:MAG: hypothetical protein K9J16_16975 [Melioribacteraceae bacterium]|nr:hypothetical protein [Melioribacteraceae bacterium]MCF8356521.1 hypothetical protein [Melioribacteraceae bacterium]MCF8395910.1 hypothetical protein [Melioribacteraceae bacterium]MCF8420983.1 hypothetical protein [Melioribacteraceae bacterium]
MKRFNTLFTITVAVIVFSFTGLNAQNLDETLGGLAQDAATAYVQPIVNGFSSNLNSGWFNRAPEATKFGFDLEVKIIGAGSFFGDDAKTFSTNGQFKFTTDQATQLLKKYDPALATSSNIQYVVNQNYTVGLSGPTIIGSQDEKLLVTFPGDPNVTASGGISMTGTETIEIDEVTGLVDLPVLPMGAIQLGVGTVYGTTASFRWFPTLDITDVGEFSFFGFGLMHNPTIWFDAPIPLDVAVGFFTQTMKVGDIFNSTSTQFGLFASKTFGAVISVTPYLGLTTESATTTLKYDYSYTTYVSGVPVTVDDVIEFELEGENSVGLTLGANFKLAILNISVDYKMANTNTATAALSFGF